MPKLQKEKKNNFSFDHNNVFSLAVLMQLASKKKKQWKLTYIFQTVICTRKMSHSLSYSYTMV